MKRLYIIRNDIKIPVNKLLYYMADCDEVYWLKELQREAHVNYYDDYNATINIHRDVFEEYIKGFPKKTIRKAKNEAHLLKAKEKAVKIGLCEDIDFGLVYDKKNKNCVIGIWFKPLHDEIVRELEADYVYHKELVKR